MSVFCTTAGDFVPARATPRMAIKPLFCKRESRTREPEAAEFSRSCPLLGLHALSVSEFQNARQIVIWPSYAEANKPKTADREKRFSHPPPGPILRAFSPCCPQ